MAAYMARSRILFFRSHLSHFTRIQRASFAAISQPNFQGLYCTHKDKWTLFYGTLNYSCTNIRFSSSSRSLGTQLACWNCDLINPSNALICEKCQALQELRNDMTNFHIMDLQPSFVIDTAALTKKFRALQSRLHPDKFTNKSEKEKQLSESLSSAVNKAYSTLLKPIPRGHYLLELHGASLQEGEIQMDPEFLMEIMETNETVSVANNVDEIREINEKNKITIDELISRVGGHFDNGDILKAKETLAKLNYYTNIEDKIKDIERRSMDYSPR